MGVSTEHVLPPFASRDTLCPREAARALALAVRFGETSPIPLPIPPAIGGALNVLMNLFYPFLIPHHLLSVVILW